MIGLGLDPTIPAAMEATRAYADALVALRAAEAEAAADPDPETFEDVQRRAGQRFRVEGMRAQLHERLAKLPEGSPSATRIINDILTVNGTLNELDSEEV